MVREDCGPESWMPSALRVSRLGGGWSSFFKVTKGEEAMEPDRAPRTPPGWTAEIFLVIYKRYPLR
jgi:hypothetical protein